MLCDDRVVVGGDGLVQVHLVGLPLQARAGFSQHLQELTREFSLIHLEAQRHPGSSLPPRLLRLAAELRTTYADFRVQPDAVVDAALAAGRETCDVTYTVPERAGDFLRRLGEALEEADDFCRSRQHLLSLPAPEEAVAYRRWFVAEATRQLAGQPPRPWRRPFPAPPGGTGPAGTPSVPVPAAPRWEDATPVPRPSGAGDEVAGRPLVVESLASSVAGARRYVREALRGLGAERFEEAAELGVSELVTNAVLHARTAVTVTVRTTGGRVRVEVRDTSPLPVQPRHFALTSTTGRGLQLVAALSSGWGVEAPPAGEGPGKTVWFEPREVDAPLVGTGQDWGLGLDPAP